LAEVASGFGLKMTISDEQGWADARWLVLKYPQLRNIGRDSSASLASKWGGKHMRIKRRDK